MKNALNGYEANKVDVSDAEACLVYLRAKGHSDNGLLLRYSIDDRYWLVNINWADSCFGDVVGFDSTYNRNKY